ncbi:methanol--corrinoid methyltransferase [Deltaproteobacteria bacterium Smac51]|nr:methanol--corrinoid methyltransferase [Deltaproteobacteria bacterium Smac51]
MKYSSLAISNPNDLIYGKALSPVTTRNYGLEIGGGLIYPELNFTLPPMKLEEANLKEMYGHYQQIVTQSLKRAAELGAPGVVLECETLPPQTEFPQWSENICKILLDGMADANAKYGLKSALRFTPNDNRDMMRPPQMRSGRYWEAMLDTFERVTKLGADMISIESIGGKETHDEALIKCDIEQVIFSLAVLATRDMKFLWENIVSICDKNNSIPAGDSSCGFGNTAMVLAEQRLIPNAFSTVVRVLTAVRALVALECGARGPSKDCAYENPFLKAITGTSISCEGKTSACAHLSPVGNIAAAYADLWSNESVQNVMLLGSTAPVAYMEQLTYDCRLFNTAAAQGGALTMRNWLVDSDAGLDNRAYIFRPENVISLSQAIVSGDDYYDAARKAALATARMLIEGGKKGETTITKMEYKYLENIIKTVEAMPTTEGDFITKMMGKVDLNKFDPKGYDLAA